MPDRIRLEPLHPDVSGLFDKPGGLAEPIDTAIGLRDGPPRLFDRRHTTRAFGTTDVAALVAGLDAVPALISVAMNAVRRRDEEKVPVKLTMPSIERSLNDFVKPR